MQAACQVARLVATAAGHCSHGLKLCLVLLVKVIYSNIVEEVQDCLQRNKLQGSSFRNTYCLSVKTPGVTVCCARFA